MTPYIDCNDWMKLTSGVNAHGLLPCTIFTAVSHDTLCDHIMYAAMIVADRCLPCRQCTKTFPFCETWSCMSRTTYGMQRVILRISFVFKLSSIPSFRYVVNSLRGLKNGEWFVQFTTSVKCKFACNAWCTAASSPEIYKRSAISHKFGTYISAYTVFVFWGWVATACYETRRHARQAPPCFDTWRHLCVHHESHQLFAK